MKSQDPQVTLLQAARIVARGSELDAKLDALAVHVLDGASATAAIVYLYDPVVRVLVPAAQASLDADKLANEGAISIDDQAELVAQVVRERRIATSSDGGTSRALTIQGHDDAALVALPLIASD